MNKKIKLGIGKIYIFLESVCISIRNTISYIRYKVMKEIWPAVVTILGVVGVIIDMLDFGNSSYLGKILLIFSLITALVAFVKNYDKRYMTLEKDPYAYDYVVPYDTTWTKLKLNLPNNVKETVFYNDDIDNWLKDSEHEISLMRDKGYEHELKKRIARDWNEVYSLFLRYNYRYSIYSGKQFYNEAKFGISCELDTNLKDIKIHKTCYYDSYLTNVIPGSSLKNNQNGEICNTKNLMPYEEIGKDLRIRKYEDDYRANEPGVTTVCIGMNNQINLWVQNGSAMSSSNLTVATGSGSADWKDCKNFLSAKDGFRKAIIYGMERELYEESNGELTVDRETFMNDTDTRIIGYFRWLSKAGKAEFVGISRLNKNYRLSPQKSEVSTQIRTAPINANTIKELKKNIEAEVTDIEGGYEVKRCAVSCIMALLALKRECETYCNNCEERVKCDDDINMKCLKRPYEVLFE